MITTSNKLSKINCKTNKTEKLQSSLQNTCLCQNKTPELVTTIEESEIVCRNCGVVFGFDDDDENNNNTISYQHVTKARINLYMKRQIGSRSQDYKKIIHCKNLRIDNSKCDVMCLGIICDKLKLPDIISEQCWRLYLKVKHSQPNFTRAKSACLAIYQTCRQHKIPFSEESVRDIVCQSFGVKNAPQLKSIIFKVKPSDTAIGNIMGIIAKDESDTKRQFYLNQHVIQAQKRHNLSDITLLKQLTIRYYENFRSVSHLNNNAQHTVMKNTSITDYNTLAKRAVLLAIQRCIMH